MGYNIKYGETTVKEVVEEHNSKRRSPVIWWFLTACCILAFVLIDAGTAIREFLIPGNDTVTQEAMTAFAENVRAGETVKDAFTDFCLEIIENAGIPK